ncbi:MAG: hypothetical protein HC820_02955 [Hydrococcus sp. RM1_1_31]|nr:hypothetical protein [Hydrococcus sp. RM1_1_31]
MLDKTIKIFVGGNDRELSSIQFFGDLASDRYNPLQFLQLLYALYIKLFLLAY